MVGTPDLFFPNAGVSIKAGLPPPVGLFIAVCLNFINEIKIMHFKKNSTTTKKQIQQQRRPLKILNATKAARFLMPRTLEIAVPSC